MHPESKQMRDRWSKLRKLMNDWDPAGLIALGAPADEYDCVSGPLLRRLHEQQGAAAVSDYLAKELSEHFGAKPADTHDFSARVVAWYATFTTTYTAR